MQKRQATKDVCPSQWDLSVAEHLRPGEDFLSAAVRGLHEELGVEGVDLEAVGETHREMLELPELGIRDYEFQQCFRGVTDEDVKIDVSEVAEYRLFALTELRAAFETSPDEFTPWFRRRANDVGLFD